MMGERYVRSRWWDLDDVIWGFGFCGGEVGGRVVWLVGVGFECCEGWVGGMLESGFLVKMRASVGL